MFHYIRYDEKLKEITGTTPGCGCCSEEMTLSLKDLDEHISSLIEELEEAKKIRESYFKKGIKV